MSESGNLWMPAFFVAAALLVLFKAWRGWRLGVVRQIAGLVALIAAWVCGIFGGKLVAPLLRELWPGPDRLLSICRRNSARAGGLSRHHAGERHRFQKDRTSKRRRGALWIRPRGRHRRRGIRRGLRLDRRPRRAPARDDRGDAARRGEESQHSRKSLTRTTGPVIGGLAELKRGVEHGAVGAVVEHLDPVPDHGLLHARQARARGRRSREHRAFHPIIPASSRCSITRASPRFLRIRRSSAPRASAITWPCFRIRASSPPPTILTSPRHSAASISKRLSISRSSPSEPPKARVNVEVSASFALASHASHDPVSPLQSL